MELLGDITYESELTPTPILLIGLKLKYNIDFAKLFYYFKKYYQ